MLTSVSLLTSIKSLTTKAKTQVPVEIWRKYIEPTMKWTAVKATNSSQSTSTFNACLLAKTNSFDQMPGVTGRVRFVALLRSVAFKGRLSQTHYI